MAVDEEPGRALLGDGRAAQAAGLRQHGPVVAAGAAGLQRGVVVALLGVPVEGELQLRPVGRGDAGEVDGAHQPLPVAVGVQRGGHPGAGVGGVRVGDPGVPARLRALELRELRGRQGVGGDRVGAGGVQRVARGVAEAAARVLQGSGAGEAGGAGGAAASVGAEPVLAEVVGHGAADLGVAAGQLTGLDQPAALVEEVAHRQLRLPAG